MHAAILQYKNHTITVENYIYRIKGVLDKAFLSFRDAMNEVDNIEAEIERQLQATILHLKNPE